MFPCLPTLKMFASLPALPLEPAVVEVSSWVHRWLVPLRCCFLGNVLYRHGHHLRPSMQDRVMNSDFGWTVASSDLWKPCIHLKKVKTIWNVASWLILTFDLKSHLQDGRQLKVPNEVTRWHGSAVGDGWLSPCRCEGLTNLDWNHALQQLNSVRPLIDEQESIRSQAPGRLIHSSDFSDAYNIIISLSYNSSYIICMPRFLYFSGIFLVWRHWMTLTHVDQVNTFWFNMIQRLSFICLRCRWD